MEIARPAHCARQITFLIAFDLQHRFIRALGLFPCQASIHAVNEVLNWGTRAAHNGACSHAAGALTVPEWQVAARLTGKI